MSAPWWNGPLCCFDTETTGTDVENDRIVTAAVITVGPDGIGERQSWLIDPGIEIPESATAIHRVTTEQARAEGVEPRNAVWEIAQFVTAAWQRGTGIVACNATFDLSILDRELRRHGWTGIEPVGPVLDPLVMDRGLDRYRKGSRKLVDLAKHYGVRLDGAHAAHEDALAAGRVVWKLARHDRWGKVLQPMTLAEMQVWQAKAHRAWAEHFQEYLRTKANPRQPDAVIDQSWPWRPLPVQEGVPA